MAIPTSWTNAKKQLAGLRPFVEVVIDPEDMNIVLDGFHDLSGISTLVNEVSLDPLDFGKIFLNDLYLQFNYPDELFSGESNTTGQDKPYHSWAKSCYMKGATTYVSSTAAILRPWAWFGAKAGDRVFFSNGDSKEEIYVNSVQNVLCQEMGDYPDDYKQQLNYTGLAESYASTDIVSTKPILGKQVSIRLRLDGLGTSGTQEIFRGIIRDSFEWRPGSATLKVDNLFGVLLSKPLVISSASADPTQRINAAGTLASTISWTTKTGTGTLSAPTVYTGARLGKWEITFSNATNFTVTGPNCNAKAGTTGTDFYDQTDATDSQIKIAIANWGGTPAAADVVEFYVCANFNGVYPSVIVKSLLEDYAGISSDYVDSTAFTAVQSGENGVAYISFDTEGTVGEAISSILPHSLLWLSQGWDAKFTIFNPYAQTTASCTSIAGYSIIGTQSSRLMNYYNEVVVYYGWDYAAGAMQYRAVYPASDTENHSYQIYGEKRTVEIYMPGFYLSEYASDVARKLYEFWSFGVKVMQSTISLYALNANMGQLYAFYLSNTSNVNYGLDERYGVIFRREMNLVNNFRVTLTGYFSVGYGQLGAWGGV